MALLSKYNPLSKALFKPLSMNPSNNLTIQPFNTLTIQPCNNVTIQQSNHSTIQLSNNLNPNPLLKTLRLCLCLLLTLPSLPSLATIVTVKKDGTGDYIIIQDAVWAAANWDTVLVFPGTYYENVDFISKNLTLASLNLTTGEEAFIHNTIIDGNHSGSCVKVSPYLTTGVIHGFTLQNGSGTIPDPVGIANGGGILIDYKCSASIINCVIKNNKVSGHGGGICGHMRTNIYLEGVRVFNNHANGSGGGIAIPYESICTFDSINLSTFYLNYASRGNEIHNSGSHALNIYLDTCSVLNPDTYYISSMDEFGFENNDVTYTIQHQKINPLDTNLFVDPVFGSDSNSGLNSGEPLRTIAFANTLLIVDSLDNNTIFLADGIYSDSANGEKFPLNIRPFVNITGQSRKGTILDGEYRSKLLKGNNEVSNYSFSKMTLRRGTFVDYDDIYTNTVGLVWSYYINENISFDSVLFTQGWSEAGDAIVSVSRSNNTRFTNCEFAHNKGEAALRINLWEPTDTCRIYNSVFRHNIPDYDAVPEYQIGKGLTIKGGNGVGIVVNSLFYNNVWSAFTSTSPCENYLVNCTFSGNSADNYTGIGLKNSTTNMYNCISFDEGDYPFALWNTEQLDSTRLNIYHSLLENGEDDIYVSPYCDGWCAYHYDESNIEGDPLFYGGPDFPYNLSDDSPCIDAGTLDLPAFIELPDVDLAGNPRVVNGKIDIGAYEWNPTVGEEEILPHKRKEMKLLQVGPNPFSDELKIFALFEKSSLVKIEIFANSGLRVKTLVDGNTLPGKSIIRWNGRDNNGGILPPGIYNIIMTIDNLEAGRAKVVKL